MMEGVGSDEEVEGGFGAEEFRRRVPDRQIGRRTGAVARGVVLGPEDFLGDMLGEEGAQDYRMHGLCDSGPIDDDYRSGRRRCIFSGAGAVRVGAARRRMAGLFAPRPYRRHGESRERVKTCVSRLRGRAGAGAVLVPLGDQG